MSVACFIGAIIAAAYGVWWLTTMLFIAGLLLAAVTGLDAYDRREAEALRRRSDAYEFGIPKLTPGRRAAINAAVAAKPHREHKAAIRDEQERRR